MPGGEEISFEASNNNQQGRTCGSSRDERLDPFALPLRFELADHAGRRTRASGRACAASAWCCAAVSRGIKMALNLPVAAYLGVAIRMEPPAGDGGRAPSPSCSSIPIPACRSRFTAPPTAPTSSPNGRRGVARSACRSWSPRPTGGLREPFDRIGGVRVGPPISRRRRRSALQAGGRPALPLRRRTGTLSATPLVHRGGREIIARN